MSNADELLTDARQARHDRDEALAAGDREAAHEMEGVTVSLWDRLDDHMSAGGAPPADWPRGPRDPRDPDWRAHAARLVDHWRKAAEVEMNPGFANALRECAEQLANAGSSEHLVPPAPSPNAAEVRQHSSDDMTDERFGTAPVGVILRVDGSVDVYGYVAVTDERPPKLGPSAALQALREADLMTIPAHDLWFLVAGLKRELT